MPEEQDKKQEVKDDPTKAEQAKQELSDEALDGLSGGVGEKGEYYTPAIPYIV